MLERAGITALPPCARPVPDDPHDGPEALCPFGSSSASQIIDVDLGDGDDIAMLRLSGVDVLIRGGPGDDSIGDGNFMEGGPGDDHLSGAAGKTRLAGGPGDDSFLGGGSRPILGGPGRDDIFDLGDLDGRRPVRDVAQLRDGAVDVMGCSLRDKRDLLVADPIDFIFGCTRPRRSGASYAVPVYVTPDNEDDRGAMVTLGCSDDGPPICRGSVTVRSARGLLGETTFREQRATNYLNYEINSRIPRRALMRLGQVTAELRSIDSAGRWHQRTFVLPVGGD